MTQQVSDTQALQQSLVELLMAVIGAPDDQEVARAADEAVRQLDTRLTAAPLTPRTATAARRPGEPGA